MVATGPSRYSAVFGSILVRRLTIMGQPLAVGQLHVGESRFEGRILRAAGVNPKVDFIRPLPHMADSHLREMRSILGAFDAVVVFAPAESVPHGFDGRGDFGRRPVRVSQVRRHAAKGAGIPHSRTRWSLSASSHCPDTSPLRIGRSDDGCRGNRFSPGKRRTSRSL